MTAGPMKAGKLIIISGPGGVGKDTIIKMLQQRRPDLVRIVTYTARPPREGEVNGVDYNFISNDEFVRKIKRGELLEYARPRGSYYGTPLKRIMEILDSGQTGLMHINVDGVLAINKKMPNQIISIFIMPPTIQDLEARLLKRGNDTVEGIAQRLTEAQREMTIAKSSYDHLVVNPTSHPEQAVAAIEKIIINWQS